MRYFASGLTNGCWPTLALFLVFAGTSSAPSLAQQDVAKDHAIAVSIHQFTLQREGDNFFLQPLPLAAKHPRIAIPRDWLVPPHDTHDEEDTSPVDPFNYDRRVTSFPIGNGAIGLRFSSFDEMTEGSLAAAEGRDVFLIYDPSEGRLRPGGFDLGITKERYRSDGCFHAQMVHLLIADTNKDGLTDIGAVKEEIWCPEISEDEDEVPDGAIEQKKLPSELTNIVEMHLYQQHSVSWYLYTPQGWKLDPDQTWMPDTFSELPLTGLALSPVDVVGEVLWHSLDPKSWVDPPLYVPTYRKKLIAEGLPGLKKSRNLPRVDSGQRK
jgi:hypothetical protein